jgi:hypothetical protein
MSERIKELWEQCKTPNWSIDNPVYDHELFAELIIKEICELLEPDEEWRRDASWGYLGGDEGVELLDCSVRTIRGHFVL